MQEVYLYSLIALVLGVGLTVLMFYYLVVKRNKVSEKELRDENARTLELLGDIRKSREELNSQFVATQTELKFAQQKLIEQKEELENLNNKLAKDFENIANKVVHTSSKIMQERHEEKLTAMLD